MEEKVNDNIRLQEEPDIFSGGYKERMEAVQALLHLNENFDILHRQVTIGGKKASLFAVDGFLTGTVSEKVMEFFYSIQEQDMPEDYSGFVDRYAPYVDIVTLEDQNKFVQMLLSGITCILIEGYRQIIGFDFREYPSRSVDEPEKDKVLRGSRDGFIEALVPNAALVRRRIRDVNLVFQILSVGRSSKTDVAVVYMKDRVKQGDLQEILNRIKNINVDSLTLNKESLAEELFRGAGTILFHGLNIRSVLIRQQPVCLKGASW